MQTNSMPAIQRQPLSFLQTILIAMLVESVLIIASINLVYGVMQKKDQDLQNPMEVLFEDIKKDEPRPTPPKVIPNKAIPVAIKHKTEVTQKVEATPHPPEPVQAVNVTPIASPQIDSPAVVAATPAPVVPSPPLPTNLTAQKEAEFNAKVRAAIQAAVIFPSMARTMGFVGRARVEFSLRDNIPSRIKIIQSSNIGMIDRAAMSAVSAAVYPETPDSLKGKDQLFQVTVLFEVNSMR